MIVFRACGFWANRPLRKAMAGPRAVGHAGIVLGIGQGDVSIERLLHMMILEHHPVEGDDQALGVGLRRCRRYEGGRRRDQPGSCQQRSCPAP
jgi:hypothetical protein